MVEDRKRILVVDDEANVRESLKMILGRSYDVETAESSEDAERFIAQSGAALQPDLMLVDVIMPGLDGLSLLERIKGEHPNLPVIMLTASSTVRSAVHAMKIGAVDYLSKPFDVDQLLTLIQTTLMQGPGVTAEEIEVVTHEMSRPNLPPIDGDFGTMVGKHPLMLELFSKIDQLAGANTTVLITGESGTGKELIARQIHNRSRRSKGPFIALNCAAIPESLIESELFGHEKGAFTHAVERRIGQFELSNGGTLFLDEIGELSLQVQVKMLRFLQEQEFYRVGSSKSQKVDVRVVAATNKNLENSIQEGKFRQDLYYRINVVNLESPALRSRVEDIPALLEAFVSRMSPIYGGRNPQFSEEAFDIFSNYSWPGNVRELENVAESILALSNAELVTANEIPARIRQAASSMFPGDGGEEIRFEDAERKFEMELIIKALKKSNYVQTRAAELLGISRRILKYKMDKLGISDSAPGEQN